MRGTIIKGYLFAIVSAVIYGCMPLMAKHIYAEGVDPFTLVFLRNLFSIVPLAILAYRETGTLRIPVRWLPSIGLISLLGCCVTPILLFSSYQFMASGTATVIHFAYPAIVVIGEILFFRKKVQLCSVLSVLLCVAGVSLFYSPQQTISLTGSVLALSSALTFASYVILLSHFGSRDIPNYLFSFYITLMSAAASLVFCLTAGRLALPSSPVGWGLCVLFSLAVTTGAVVLFQKSTFLIGGERASILSTLEPITSMVIGVLIFQEPFGIRVLIGSIMVVAASIITAVFGLKRKKA